MPSKAQTDRQTDGRSPCTGGLSMYRHTRWNGAPYQLVPLLLKEHSGGAALLVLLLKEHSGVAKEYSRVAKE